MEGTKKSANSKIIIAVIFIIIVIIGVFIFLRNQDSATKEQSGAAQPIQPGSQQQEQYQNFDNPETVFNTLESTVGYIE